MPRRARASDGGCLVDGRMRLVSRSGGDAARLSDLAGPRRRPELLGERVRNGLLRRSPSPGQVERRSAWFTLYERDGVHADLLLLHRPGPERPHVVVRPRTMRFRRRSLLCGRGDAPPELRLSVAFRTSSPELRGS